MTFLICYDLLDDKNYERLIGELKRYGCTRRQRSAWHYADKTGSETADTLINHFAKFIDNNDRLIVVQIAVYRSRNDEKG